MRPSHLLHFCPIHQPKHMAPAPIGHARHARNQGGQQPGTPDNRCCRRARRQVQPHVLIWVGLLAAAAAVAGAIIALLIESGIPYRGKQQDASGFRPPSANSASAARQLEHDGYPDAPCVLSPKARALRL